tara:strand:- start:1058 stop:2047 length:990 start_codon:yes stop_codon:yes gene_type:complete
MHDLINIVRCPVSGGNLSWASDGSLIAKTGASYNVRNGIANLLPPEDAALGDGEVSKDVLNFYETHGWRQDKDGLFGESKSFNDLRPQSVEFTNRCIDRIGEKFSEGGEYLLDAGCGPLLYDHVLRYGDRFQKRVCLDLSFQGLQAAKQKLNTQGLYVQGTLTRLPLKTESMDAITCNHVIYQIPSEFQREAFLELWRVLKPGGIAVIVYVWPNAPFGRFAAKAAKYIFGMRGPYEPTPTGSEPSHVELPHNALPESWFRSQAWPFDYEIETFRVVSQSFMKNYISNDWRGRAFLNALFALQRIAPVFCGKYGDMPAIIFQKPGSAEEL